MGNSISIAVIIVAMLFGGALLGMLLARLLPEHHLSAETKSVVSVSMAVFGTLAALVLGLLISNAASSFGAKAQDVRQISADVIRLDRLLRRYGPEAQEIRELLRRYAVAKLHELFPENPNRPPAAENNATVSMLEEVENEVLGLKPANDTQHWLQSQMLQLASGAATSRWQLVQESTNKMPLPLVAFVGFWFVVIFVSFGLFAPRNMTAVVFIFLCAIGVGGAIWMVTELQNPFQGIIHVSSVPLTQALEAVSH
jgi:hypothetical protein